MKRIFESLIVMMALSGPAVVNADTVILTYDGPTFLNTVNASLTPPPFLYNTTTDHVTESIVLSASIPANFDGTVSPVSFSISDGQNTITDATATSAVFSFSTDGAGQISNWNVGATTGVYGTPQVYAEIQTFDEPFVGPGPHIEDFGMQSFCPQQGSSAACQNMPSYQIEGYEYNPGSWTMTVSPVPVPSSAWLMIVGLGSLSAYTRKRGTILELPSP